MKELFPGYYRPTEEEFDELWRKAAFVFDANVLLHIHRRNLQARRAILDTFRKLGERLWVPYEIAAEYQRNKLKVAHNLADNCKTVLDGFNGIKEQLKSRDLREHPFLDANALTEGLDQLIEQVTQAWGNSRSVSLDDAESNELASLLQGRLDEPYSGDVLIRRIEEAKTRGKTKIPPGYKDFDNKGDEVRAGGDVLIWFKIIERAKEKQCPVIFVTEDQKEDWWWIHQGRTHGPRPELGQEMWKLARQRFYMYTLSSFLGLVGKYLGQNVPSEVVDVIKEQEQKSFAKLQALNKEMLRERYEALLFQSQLLKADRENLDEQLASVDARISEDQYSPHGLEDRRQLHEIQKRIDVCDELLERVTRAITDVRSQLFGVM
ncbi:PIN-like domain-containing protein [Corallococcus sp. M7]